MTGPVLLIEREISLPPLVVWSALVDPDLVIGWFAQVALDPAGRFRLHWLDGSGARPNSGFLLERVENERLRCVIDGYGRIDVGLEARPGGLRGSRTMLRVTMTLPGGADLPAVAAEWELALDRLEELLRGHPVDWTAVRRTRIDGPVHLRNGGPVR